MRAMKLSMSAAMVVVLVAGDAAAQSCTGVPSADRQIAVKGDQGLTDGATGYGAGVSANQQGPWSVAAG